MSTYNYYINYNIEYNTRKMIISREINIVLYIVYNVFIYVLQ